MDPMLMPLCHQGPSKMDPMLTTPEGPSRMKVAQMQEVLEPIQCRRCNLQCPHVSIEVKKLAVSRGSLAILSRSGSRKMLDLERHEMCF